MALPIFAAAALMPPIVDASCNDYGWIEACTLCILATYRRLPRLSPVSKKAPSLDIYAGMHGKDHHAGHGHMPYPAGSPSCRFSIRLDAAAAPSVFGAPRCMRRLHGEVKRLFFFLFIVAASCFDRVVQHSMEARDAPAGPVPNRFSSITDEAGLEEMLKTTPLFMQDLPEDSEDNVVLQALQALAYDGTPEENYRRVLNDCASALLIDPKCVKAYYRSAKACRSLERIEEAMDACQRGLEIEPDNAALIKEKEAIVALQQKLEAKQQAKAQRDEAERIEKERIAQAIQDRGIRMITRPPVPDNPHQVHLDPESGSLQWPVFFLYPEHKESDFIAAFDETSTFEDHLSVMFDPSQPSPPWDRQGAYRPELLEVYFEAAPLQSGKGGAATTGGARGTRLVKVGRRCTLGQVLKHRAFTVVNGMPSFVVLSAVSPFKASFLARHAKD
ncbi:hypothetical protein SYNPS1DRAFT_28945 [Syncephalis pseudoplumigaleata]|uniref:Cns1/TTC4 wheel domain-containing protein n=1 Tax=Syncephalis pseudoplumigaleata TaxID=1712513 RepID=A0A4P9YZA1_9FUNG|nr:hypothetical protein SYNPS1DRAFT_28945 [Syncephalis pseudoplumigaleata]|eukprot:RKP25318.1 hypothetical protein SYNPS1DRAFT_28945 [Syncephalis pseudoplumigaleata]